MLIKNATIFQSGEKCCVDLLIGEGKILQIAEKIEVTGEKEIDATGLYLLPGLIDLHVRLKDDILSKDHIRRLQNKAKKSGITTFALMPDFSPSLQNAIEMELLKETLEEGMILSLKGVDRQKSNTLNNISTLLASGAEVIQEDSHINGNLLRRILQYALMKDVPFFCFCDNPDLNDNGVMHEGRVSAKLGLAGISKISEISEVAKVASMVKYYGPRCLFQSLSTKESLEILMEAKKSGANLFAEVSIFHLIFSDQACSDFNTLAKTYPPLRDEAERAGLMQALKDGKIDLITSLHAAKSFTRKDVAFNDAAYGVDALEDFLSLCYTHLVKSQEISMSRLLELLCERPAEVLKLENVGKIQEGYVADIVLFDPNAAYVKEDKHSLLHGMHLQGAVRHTIKRGEMV